MNIMGFPLQNMFLNVCCLVPVETCRRRTAPRWQWSTTNTSTSKPNCGCWRSSSAKETRLSSSENEIKRRFKGLMLRLHRYSPTHLTLCRSCFWLGRWNSPLIRFFEHGGGFPPEPAESRRPTTDSERHKVACFTWEVHVQPNPTFIRGRFSFSRLSETCTNNPNHTFIANNLFLSFWMFLSEQKEVIFLTLYCRSLKKKNNL